MSVALGKVASPRRLSPEKTSQIHSPLPDPLLLLRWKRGRRPLPFQTPISLIQWKCTYALPRSRPGSTLACSRERKSGKSLPT
jgi:hypothetical protein